MNILTISLLLTSREKIMPRLENKKMIHGRKLKDETRTMTYRCRASFVATFAGDVTN